MIAVGSDHAAYTFKLEIIKYVEGKGYSCRDFGADNPDASRYPEYAEAVAKSVVSGESECGLLFCGTGVGMSIAANKVLGARCVVCTEPFSALLSKQHNNTNILALGARVLGTEMAKMIIDTWMSGEFQGGRHAERVGLISEIEMRERGR